MAKLLRELYDDLRMAQSQSGRSASGGSDDPFVLQVTQMLLWYGVQAKASDIHVEPVANGARIRYRIDGMLQEMLKVPVEIRDALIRSLMVKSGMTAYPVGRSKPQDSRIDFETDGHKLDLRLSSFPSLHGDVIAIRLLDRNAPLRQIVELGMAPDVQKVFERLIARPNGLVLVAGPAGSGKTTTLYAALNKLRSPQIKIVTLEDPVEYQVDGIDQAQINPQVGLTFASGLRAVLRQDANVILVGEIRDQETANIAVRAALTGHLVLSTLHTRHSCGAITRLVDMDIEPHLICASLNGVLAQRLVRRVCRSCREPAPSAAQVVERLWHDQAGDIPPDLRNAKLVRGKGCVACNETGYQDRTGIFELVQLTDELRRPVLARETSRLYPIATAAGMRTMLRDGLEKAMQGVTAVEEILRVTGEMEEF